MHQRAEVDWSEMKADDSPCRYFGRKPTSVTSESNVRMSESSMPWEREDDGGKMYKYQYHPHGDKSKAFREAPSAMNTVIVPHVTLPVVCIDLRPVAAIIPPNIAIMPRHPRFRGLLIFVQDLHERFNKYGKEEWDY